MYIGMYWTTWIAQLKDVKVAYEDRVITNQEKGLLSNIYTGILYAPLGIIIAYITIPNIYTIPLLLMFYTIYLIFLCLVYPLLYTFFTISQINYIILYLIYTIPYTLYTIYYVYRIQDRYLPLHQAPPRLHPQHQ